MDLNNSTVAGIALLVLILSAMNVYAPGTCNKVFVIDITNNNEDSCTDTVVWEIQPDCVGGFSPVSCNESQALTLATNETKTVTCTTGDAPTSSGPHCVKVGWCNGTGESDYGDEVTVEITDLYDAFNPYNKASDQEVCLGQDTMTNANYLCDVTYNALFAADRDDDKVHFFVKNKVEPESKRDKALWEVKRGDDILESGDFSAGEEFEIAFEPSGSLHVSIMGDPIHEVEWDTFDFNAGVDSNGNGVLDDGTDEVQDSNFKLGVCTDMDYVFMRGKLTLAAAGAMVFGLFGSGAMKVFNDDPGSLLISHSVEDATVESSNPFLQLKAGADFSKSNNVKRYIFPPDSGPSEKVVESPELRESINELLVSKKQDVIDFFNNNPTVDSNTWEYSHYDGVEFEDSMDLNLGFGGADIDCDVEVTVKRNGGNLEIESLNVSGEVKDIYDFGYWDMGSVLQTGWDPSQGRDAGHIYYNTAQIEREYDSWNFSFE